MGHFMAMPEKKDTYVSGDHWKKWGRSAWLSPLHFCRKCLNDFCSHTTYWNGRNNLEWNQIRIIAYKLFVKGKDRKKSCRTGSQWTGSVRSPETQLFFFWPYQKSGLLFVALGWAHATYSFLSWQQLLYVPPPPHWAKYLKFAPPFSKVLM